MKNPANNNSPKYQEYTYVLSVSEEINIPIYANFIACLDATAEFKMGMDNGAKTGFKQGLRFSHTGLVESIQLFNNSGASNTITMAVGRGDIRDSRLNVSGSISSEGTRPDVFTEAAPIAAAAGPATTLLLATNTNRNEALFVNTGSYPVWVKSTNSVLKVGLYLAAGQSLILQTTAAIYAYNPDATNAGEVAVSELEFS